MRRGDREKERERVHTLITFSFLTPVALRDGFYRYFDPSNVPFLAPNLLQGEKIVSVFVIRSFSQEFMEAEQAKDMLDFYVNANTFEIVAKLKIHELEVCQPVQEPIRLF